MIGFFKKKKNIKGQTTIEYLVLLTVIIFLGVTVFKQAMRFVSDHFLLGMERTILATKVDPQLFYKHDLMSVKRGNE